MMHKDRKSFRVTRMDVPLELAESITQGTYDLNDAFVCQGVLYANDSFTSDPARHQEYAVMVPVNDGWWQVETFTVTAMTAVEFMLCHGRVKVQQARNQFDVDLGFHRLILEGYDG